MTVSSCSYLCGSLCSAVQSVLNWPSLTPVLQVILNMESRWLQEEDIAMSIDCGEEDWRRLHDIRLDGQLLEYVGRGKSLIDVGLAQARTPLSTRTHYFEIGMFYLLGIYLWH